MSQVFYCQNLKKLDSVGVTLKRQARENGVLFIYKEKESNQGGWERTQDPGPIARLLLKSVRQLAELLDT